MKQVLEKITADPAVEAKWLNTVSLLEFIGARKIAKTVAQQHPCLDVLEHHADETRHAYIFKKLSATLSDSPENEDYLCKEAAVEYFQSLDHGMAKWLKEQGFTPEDCYPNYLLTTSLIERRAMMLYPVYRDTTSQTAVREELVQVIAEETNHRPGIDKQLKNLLSEQGTGNLEDCWQQEDALFNRFFSQIEQSFNT